jgi:hypothetical protein
MPDTKPKPFVFVLMPFDPAFDDTYKLGIQAACKEAGAYCERVDEQLFQGSIIERVYNQISKADIIVADMTGQNPNVFYETGYAHALGKKTILLTREVKDIPFDLNQYVHIIYAGKITDLKKNLKKRIRFFIDHPDVRTKSEQPALSFHIDGQDIQKNSQVTLTMSEMDSPSSWGQHLSLDIHNPNEIPIDLTMIDIGFVFPSELGRIPEVDGADPVILPDQNRMAIRRPRRVLFPQA